MKYKYNKLFCIPLVYEWIHTCVCSCFYIVYKYVYLYIVYNMYISIFTLTHIVNTCLYERICISPPRVVCLSTYFYTVTACKHWIMYLKANGDFTIYELIFWYISKLAGKTLENIQEWIFLLVNVIPFINL